MKREIVALLILPLTFIIGALLFFLNLRNKREVVPPFTNESAVKNNSTIPNTVTDQKNKPDFQAPLSRAAERITKKPFGILIDPKTSPVQPEKFSGYHTGTDFEIFPEETDVDVSVRAVCSGKIELKKYATGYGGLVVESCLLNNNPITVIYGHLKLASATLAIGDSLLAGDTLGILGKGYSSETSGERKHLHLGFHKGSEINISGYVPNKKDLSDWIDPCLYACQD